MAGRIAYYGNIATQGLVLNLDAAIQGSYPKTGSTWFDISNNGNNGTLTNGPLYTGSDYGAIRFDGTNDYVTGSVINTPNQLSVFCFRNPKPRAGTVYPSAINKWFAQPGDNRSWTIGSQPGGVDYVMISSDGTYTNSTIKRFEFSSSVSNNIWTQVGFTFNNGTLVPYLNGAPASYTASLNANITSIYTSSIGYSLGYQKDGAFDTYFSGSIATAQIYNQSLSQFQVWQNFNAYKSRYGIPDIVTDGLVLNLDAGNPYSYLSGSSGTTWSNTVPASSSISGSLENGTTYSNGAMVFDGVDDYVNNGTSFVNLTTQLTICFWGKIAGSPNDGILVTKGENDGSITSNFGFQISNIGGPNRLRLYAKASGQNYITIDSSDNIRDNNINLYTLTFNSGTVIFYKNSSLYSSHSFGLSTLPSTTGPLYVGALKGYSAYYPGNIYSIQIYNRALSATEVQQNFNALRGRYGI
jgi:hypothetical protein